MVRFTGMISALAAAGCLAAVFAPVVAAAPANSSAAVLYSWGDLQTWAGVAAGWTANPSSVPLETALPGGVTPTAVSAGGTTLALGSDGNVYAWGNATGNGTLAPSSTPVRALLPSGVTATAVSSGGA